MGWHRSSDTSFLPRGRGVTSLVAGGTTGLRVWRSLWRALCKWWSVWCWPDTIGQIAPDGGKTFGIGWSDISSVYRNPTARSLECPACRRRYRTYVRNRSCQICTLYGLEARTVKSTEAPTHTEAELKELVGAHTKFRDFYAVWDQAHGRSCPDERGRREGRALYALFQQIDQAIGGDKDAA